MRKWHRWFGLPAGLFLILAGFTGVWLEVERFFGEDEALREKLRDLPATARVDGTLSVQLGRAVEAVKAKAGDQGLDKVVLQLKGEAPTATFFLAETKAAAGRRLEVNLQTGAVVQEADYETDSFILRLHSGEAFGDGGMVLGMGWGAALVVLSVSGLVIYWKMRPKNATGLRRIFWLLPVALAFAPAGLRAGTPFFTDDPFFIPAGWEHKFAGVYEHTVNANTLLAPIWDINYTIVEHLKVNLTLAEKTVWPQNEAGRTGLADTDFKFKWRFLDESTNHWWPAISTAPNVTFPTASQSRGLGDGVWRLRFPVEVGKTWGNLLVYADAGYQWALDKGATDNLFVGACAQYQFTPHWNFGAELYNGTPVDDAESWALVVNVGGSYTFNPHWQLQASLARTLRDPSRGGSEVLTQLILQWNP